LVGTALYEDTPFNWLVFRFFQIFLLQERVCEELSRFFCADTTRTTQTNAVDLKYLRGVFNKPQGLKGLTQSFLTDSAALLLTLL